MNGCLTDNLSWTSCIVWMGAVARLQDNVTNAMLPTRTIGARIASTSPRTVADAYSRDTSLCLSIGSRSSLASIGLVIDLGHHSTQCEFTYEIRECVIVDTTGIHNVNVRLCLCGTPLRTLTIPPCQVVSVVFQETRTLFTFTVLDQFHSLTLQSKIAAYDFCVALEHLTDNSGCLTLQFLLSMRIWRHLKITKRAGCGLNPAGVEATAHGECAVECPCVHIQRRTSQRTGRPAQGNTTDPFVSPDNRRKLRLRNKDGKSRETSLGRWVGSLGPSRPYLNHIKQYGYQQAPVRPNLCDSELRAVDHANKRRSDGYVATGVGGVVCARHGLVRPNGMGDLQKGER
ncbi:MFS domain-containing protein [Salix suchowensis]|nr:MFS domain-containing protein [Salix suchowensis]